MISRRIAKAVTRIAAVLGMFAPSTTHPAEQAAGLDSSPSLILVIGAPGLEEYKKSFEESASRWIENARHADARITVIGRSEDSASSDYERLKRALESESKESAEELWLVFIGHGTYDGKEAKFNLQGPDITAAECAEWLIPFQRPVAIINCASSSGPFINKLSATRRVIVTATKSGYEQNLTRFGRYFSEAISDPDADLDKDGQVSVLEAFIIASNGVQEFYSTAGRLATEHALIEDNGDALGTPADWFRGTRPIKKAQNSATPDGFRAHQIHFIRSPLERQLPADVRQRRDQLELEIAELRDSKTNYSESDYFNKLESILVEIASLYEQSEKSKAE